MVEVIFNFIPLPAFVVGLAIFIGIREYQYSIFKRETVRNITLLESRINGACAGIDKLAERVN